MDYEKLESLLTQRLEVIRDEEMRHNNPEKQLELLKDVSMKIDAWRDTNISALPFKLKHFLENYSLDKALSYIHLNP